MLDRLEALNRFKSFSEDNSGASSCNDTSDCVQFVTSNVDIDLQYIELTAFHTVEANLASALGSCKLRYQAEVRAKNGIINDQYDIKIHGEVYDMYDFNYGNETYMFDLNSGGAIVQVGHENTRPSGSVFISVIPFELTYSLDCFPLIECTFSEDMLSSELDDFSADLSWVDL
ncbi:MAG: hypothetical protein P8179_23995 [Candidatus Thiodiazotropha sp.]